jgi:hypothetical protein
MRRPRFLASCPTTSRQQAEGYVRGGRIEPSKSVAVHTGCNVCRVTPP